MPYLSTADLAAIGPKATPAQAASAEALVNAYLRRPEGVVWAPDGNGAPCYMMGATPSFSLALTSALAPGLNVTATASGWVSPDLVGDVLVIDRGTPAETEALVVTSVAGQAVTFASVAFAHAVGAVLDAGMLIREEKALPAKRPVMMLSRPPALRLVAAQGRYGFGRRSQQATGLYEDIGLIATLQQFGPFLWQPIDVSQVSLSSTTGELWVPAGLYLASYTDVRATYVAGYGAAPAAVKAACMSLVTSFLQYPQLMGNLKAFAAGGSKLERFAASNLDPDLTSQLDAYKARLFA